MASRTGFNQVQLSASWHEQASSRVALFSLANIHGIQIRVHALSRRGFVNLLN